MGRRGGMRRGGVVREIEDEHARRHKTIQAAAVGAGANLAQAGQRRVAELPQQIAVGRRVQDPRMGRVGEVQTARTIGGDCAHRRNQRL